MQRAHSVNLSVAVDLPRVAWQVSRTGREAAKRARLADEVDDVGASVEIARTEAERNPAGTFGCVFAPSNVGAIVDDAKARVRCDEGARIEGVRLHRRVACTPCEGDAREAFALRFTSSMNDGEPPWTSAPHTAPVPPRRMPQRRTTPTQPRPTASLDGNDLRHNCCPERG